MTDIQDNIENVKDSVQDTVQNVKDKVQDTVQNVKDNVQDTVQNVQGKVQDTVQNVQGKVQDTVQNVKEPVKDNLPSGVPTPQTLEEEASMKSSVNSLKKRLEWGEPALTIIDVRDRDAFNQERITGAIALPSEELVERALTSLDFTRDIYVYGGSEGETAQAVSALSSAGFKNVVQLEGGLSAWKAISGPTEGVLSVQNPDLKEQNPAQKISETMKTHSR